MEQRFIEVKSKSPVTYGEAVEIGVKSVEGVGKQKAKGGKLLSVDEGRKRVLLIAAAILAARRLAQMDRVRMVPASVSAIADAVQWAEEIMKEIDRKWPTR
jgi:hypothetical protein